MSEEKSQAAGKNADAQLMGSEPLATQPTPPQHPVGGNSNNPVQQPISSQAVYYIQYPNMACTVADTLQGGGFGAGMNQVILTQPIPVENIIKNNERPPDYLCPSVMSCLCCCWPLGLAAVFFACLANFLADNGHMKDAKIMSNWSRNMFVLSVVLGIVAIIILIVYFTMFVGPNSKY